MLYTHENISNLDLTKYTRFVTIGCSFTRWDWPTWAECLAQEMPNAHFINVGCPGAGNQYINTMINFLSRKYNLGPETLFGIMWSTFYREDRYVLENAKGRVINNRKRGWHAQGSILTHGAPIGVHQDYSFLDIDTLEPYHYVIRDLALINSTNCYLKSAKFDSLTMITHSIDNMMPPQSDSHIYSDRCQAGVPSDQVDDMFQEAYDLYHGDLENDLVGSVIHGPNDWPIKHTYPGVKVPDYHPRTVDYATWMSQCGLPITPGTQEYAQKWTDLVDARTDTSWHSDWPWVSRPIEDVQLDFYEKQFIDQALRA